MSARLSDAGGIAPALLPVDDAARYLGTSRSSLYALFSEGRLRPVKLGKRTLVHRTQLDALAADLPPATIRQRTPK